MEHLGSQPLFGSQESAQTGVSLPAADLLYCCELLSPALEDDVSHGFVEGDENVAPSPAPLVDRDDDSDDVSSGSEGEWIDVPGSDSPAHGGRKRARGDEEGSDGVEAAGRPKKVCLSIEPSMLPNLLHDEVVLDEKLPIEDRFADIDRAMDFLLGAPRRYLTALEDREVEAQAFYLAAAILDRHAAIRPGTIPSNGLAIAALFHALKIGSHPPHLAEMVAASGGATTRDALLEDIYAVPLMHATFQALAIKTPITFGGSFLEAARAGPRGLKAGNGNMEEGGAASDEVRKETAALMEAFLELYLRRSQLRQELRASAVTAAAVHMVMVGTGGAYSLEGLQEASGYSGKVIQEVAGQLAEVGREVGLARVAGGEGAA
eukprot:evm.model.scf_214.3 EVM.evm.TU.scf_214.3   scf_214:59257-62347(+)